MTTHSTPQAHAQAAALAFPCTRAWIPCEASVPLGTLVTIQDGTSRKTVRVIGNTRNAIMLDNLAPTKEAR